MTSVMRRALMVALPFVLAVSALVGCLGEPEIDERWTLLEFVDVAPTPDLPVAGGQALDVTVRGRITYRQILTGFMVAEVRYSDTVAPATVALNPDEHTLPISLGIDQILANSVTAGRATRAITGFDHLMQEIDLQFTAQVPDTVGSGGLYLLLYMGEGDEIQLSTGEDSLVVTPFVSTDYEILHTGFPLNIRSPGGGSTP